MQFYLGFGPIDNSNTNFEVCVLIRQSSSYSHSSCSVVSNFSSLYNSPAYYYLDLGVGMQGTVNSIYMTYKYLKFPNVFTQNGDGFGTTRNTCFDTIYEYEPNWIGIEGWGNGIINSSLDSTVEVCDDGNNSNGDGWSSTCQEEYRWQWTVTANVWYSLWKKRCGNGLLESSQGEFWDDGNASNDDGCSNIWVKEVGYSFTGGEGQLTVATPICGDLMRVPPEVWDDNDISDGN